MFKRLHAAFQAEIGHKHLPHNRKGAKIAFAQALRLAPDNSRAHFGMATIFYTRKDFANAARHYQEVLKSRPLTEWPEEDLGYAYRLAEALRHQHKDDEAIQIYRQIVALRDPAYSELCQRKINNLLFNSDGFFTADEARIAKSFARDLDPDNQAEYYFQIGTSLWQARDTKSNKPNAKYEILARKCIDMWLDLNPQHATAGHYLAAGPILEDTRDERGAEQCYMKVLEIDPEYKPQETGKAFCRLALTFYLLKKYEQAEFWTREAMQRIPDDPGYYPVRHLARILDAQGKYEEAEQYHIQAIASFPYDGLIYYNFAKNLSEQDKFEEAEKHYKKAIQLLFKDDQLAEIYYEYGSCLYQMGMRPDAEAAFEKACELAPAQSKSYMMLAEMSQEEQNFNTAMEYLVSCRKQLVKNRYHDPDQVADVDKRIENLKRQLRTGHDNDQGQSGHKPTEP